MTKLVIIKMITLMSLQYGVDPRVAVSVVAVESSFNVNAIGVTQDIGLFQLNPKSFPQYTKQQLLNPELNIRLGVQYLAKVKAECRFKQDLNYLVCWNAGPNYAKRVKHPALFPYVKKVARQMASI